MLQNFKNIALVSLSTVGSRLLGLLRDILIFAALGASLWNSAFILAFTLPNLFRRLLGEGALSSAIVPVFSDVLEREGQSGAFRFFNQVLAHLLLALVIIIGLGLATRRRCTFMEELRFEPMHALIDTHTHTHTHTRTRVKGE